MGKTNGSKVEEPVVPVSCNRAAYDYLIHVRYRSSEALSKHVTSFSDMDTGEAYQYGVKLAELSAAARLSSDLVREFERNGWDR